MRHLDKPAQSRALLVLGHGAGAGMRHAFMEALTGRLVDRQIAVLRYEFPYMAAGKKRPDHQSVLVQTVREACAEGAGHGLPLFAGGKSMGGRMTSLAQAAEPLPAVRGLVFVGFPLHPADRPAVTRAGHLPSIRAPLLFLQGDRDKLADLGLIRTVCGNLRNATLHEFPGADHGFHVLKRSGRTDEQVLDELADTAAAFIFSGV